MKTEIEIFDIDRNQATVYVDFTVHENDDLVAECSRYTIPVKDLKEFIIDEQLNVELHDLTGDVIHTYGVCDYLNENLQDVVERWLEANLKEVVR